MEIKLSSMTELYKCNDDQNELYQNLQQHCNLIGSFQSKR